MSEENGSLIARLEAAEAGSRELDAGVFCATNSGWRPGTGVQTGAVIRSGIMWSPEPVTTSIDAALALAERMLPGCFPGVQKNRWARKAWTAYLTVADADDEIEQDADTPALALCIAILKAKEAQDK